VPSTSLWIAVEDHVPSSLRRKATRRLRTSSRVETMMRFRVAV
jgi:hypothetical protein